MKKFVWALGMGVVALAFIAMSYNAPILQPIVETARAGKREVVIASDSGFDGDSIYKVGVRTPGVPFLRVWSGAINQEPHVWVSGDGAILAIAKRTSTQFVRWNNLRTGGSAMATPEGTSWFSSQTALLLQQHGGAVELNFKPYNLGAWRWQDGDIKDLLDS